MPRIKQKITKRLVDSLAITGKLHEVRDAEIIGFSVRCTPAGVKTYNFQWRDRAGGWRRASIGRHGTITCDQARAIAQDWAATVAAGGTPKPDTTPAPDATTVAKLRDRFLEEYASSLKPRTKLNYQGYWDNHIIPSLKGGTLVKDIIKADAEALHLKMRKTPTNANRVIECLKKSLNLAETWKIRPEGSNPCKGIKPYKLKKRKRYLAPDEAKRIGGALREFDREGGLTARYAALVRLELYTGSRKGEWLNARWDDIDWDRLVLKLPDTKSNEEQDMILPLIAIDVLKGMERVADNPYIIAGGAKGKPLQETRRLWARLCKLAGITPGRVGLVMHDLRHSFASYTVTGTGNLALVGGLLRHADPQTTARYAHLLDDPLRHASDIGSGHLAALVDDAPLPENVVPMIKRKA